ncbi:hypothetical protein BSF40_01810 [Pseudomonas sp. ACN5]|nr:hypothetical protein BSF40_01810 [Pseudomonas sp. ACN5]
MRAFTQRQQQRLSHWREALGNPAFQSRRITPDHLSTALTPAAQRCFHPLILLTPCASSRALPGSAS